jgi:hypothetical protein
MIDFQLRPGNQIYINIPESIVQNQIEYITNIPGLQQAFDGIGLELISEERTNKEGFMTNEEIVFSQMFSSFIMKRRSPQ